MGPRHKAMISIHVQNSQNSRQKTRSQGLILPSTPSQNNFLHLKQDTKFYIQNLCEEFSKHVSNLQFCATILQINNLTMNKLSEEMHTDFYMLH